MTNKQKIKRLEELKTIVTNIESCLTQLDAVLGCIPESLLKTRVHELRKFAVEATAELVEDKSEWLDWFIFENEWGARELEAGYDNELKPVRTFADLVGLIEKSKKGKKAAKSKFPDAVDPKLVGTYPAIPAEDWLLVNSYDEVLEYRVRFSEGSSFRAFASYDEAILFSQKFIGAEDPFVLVLQREWISIQNGKHMHMKTERVAEVNIEWLKHGPRQAGQLEAYIAAVRENM